MSQFQKLYDLNLVPTHIDTHQNTHIALPILNAIVQAGEEFGVHKIRGQSSEYGWFGDYSKLKNIIKNNYCVYWNTHLPKHWKKTEKIILNAPGLGKEIGSIDKAAAMWALAFKNYFDPRNVYEVPCHLYLSEFEYNLYTSKQFLEVVSQYKIGNYYDL